MPNALAPETRWTAAQTRAQYLAIAWLRWRILVNQFRRKGGAGELVARVIVIPLFSFCAVGISVGAGMLAALFTMRGQLEHISWLLWGTFALCQFLNINLGQPGTTFDPTQLIRFPLSARSYISVKLFFGLLTPANIIVSLISLAIAIGITVVQPALWAYAFVALAVFAATNVFFTRMIFAWIDRWLSTRRAREIFTTIVFVGSLGIQYVNVTYNPAYNHRHHASGVSAQRVTMALNLYHRFHPLIKAFPPELTTSAVVSGAHADALASFEYVLGCALFAAAFFAVFAVRTHTEFRGEAFSDAANAVAPDTPPHVHLTQTAVPTLTSAASHSLAPPTTPARNVLGLSPIVTGLFAKEFLSIRRNTGVFYALIAPVVMVFLFAGKLAFRSNSFYIFPSALAYALIGIIPLAFNSFGLEGPGCQFYFMAPVRLRDVFLAKNLMNFLLAVLEVGAVLAIITYIAGAPSTQILAASLLWAMATLLVTTTMGNRRSVTAPKKIDLGRTASKQASPLSALLGIALLLAFAALGAGLLLGARYFEVMWTLPLAMAVLASIGFIVYRRGLASIEAFTLEHRDEMFEELCKK